MSQPSMNRHGDYFDIISIELLFPLLILSFNYFITFSKIYIVSILLPTLPLYTHAIHTARTVPKPIKTYKKNWRSSITFRRHSHLFYFTRTRFCVKQTSHTCEKVYAGFYFMHIIYIVAWCTNVYLDVSEFPWQSTVDARITILYIYIFHAWVIWKKLEESYSRKRGCPHNTREHAHTQTYNIYKHACNIICQ